MLLLFIVILLYFNLTVTFASNIKINFVHYQYNLLDTRVEREITSLIIVGGCHEALRKKKEKGKREEKGAN